MHKALKRNDTHILMASEKVTPINEGSKHTQANKLREALKMMESSSELVRKARSKLSNSIEMQLARAKEVCLSHICMQKQRPQSRLYNEKPKLHAMRSKRVGLPPIQAVPKIYVDTCVFLNALKKERGSPSSEKVLKAIQFSCLHGITSEQSKDEIRIALHRGVWSRARIMELCKEAFAQLEKWKVRPVNITDEILMNTFQVEPLIPDRNDIIPGATAFTEKVDAFVTLNMKDFVGLRKLFRVYKPEEAIRCYRVNDCLDRMQKSTYN